MGPICYSFVYRFRGILVFHILVSPPLACSLRSLREGGEEAGFARFLATLAAERSEVARGGETSILKSRITKKMDKTCHNLGHESAKISKVPKVPKVPKVSILRLQIKKKWDKTCHY